MSETKVKTDPIFDFNVKQYEEHRKTLLNAVKEERQMEKYVVLACAAFYSWLSTQKLNGLDFLAVAAFVPAFIVLLSLLRSHALENGVRTESEYLRKLEEQIYWEAPGHYNGPKGWEKFLAVEQRYVKRYELSQKLFWYIMLGLNILTPCTFLFLK